MADGYTIARFAEAAGVGVETVRYYQRRGLLPVPQARQRTYRHYDASLVRRLRFIRKAQAAGFTLSEIKELLRLARTGDRPRIRRIASAKLEELDNRVRELQRAVKALKALVHHCEHAPAGAPCPIIEAFDR